VNQYSAIVLFAEYLHLYIIRDFQMPAFQMPAFQVLCVFGLMMNIIHAQHSHDWPQYNNNNRNDRHFNTFTSSEAKINKMALKCDLLYTDTEFDYSLFQASPISVDDTIYVSGGGGYIKAYKVNDEGCEQKWTFDITHEILPDLIDKVVKPAARITPAYYEEALTNKGKLISLAPQNMFGVGFLDWPRVPAILFQIDVLTGQLDWKMNVTNSDDLDEAFASTFSAPTIQNDIAYFGISGVANVVGKFLMDAHINGKAEWGMTGKWPGTEHIYTQTGLMIAIDLSTQKVVWKKRTIPKKPEGWNGKWFAGGGVWGSGPSIYRDETGDRELIYFGTGNLYSATHNVEQCMNTSEVNASLGTSVKGQTGTGALECYEHAQSELLDLGIIDPLATNSIVALDAKTGEFVWNKNIHGIDIWLIPCGGAHQNECDTPVPGPDFDVAGGHSPAVIEVNGVDYVLTSTKGGLIVMLNPLTGHVMDQLDVCTGSQSGGVDFGFNFDPVSDILMVPCSAGYKLENIDTTSTFLSRSVQKLANGEQLCQTGLLKGIDMKTKELLWQVVPPNPNAVSGHITCQNNNVNYWDKTLKHGLLTTKNLKDVQDSNVIVHYYDDMVMTDYVEKTDYQTSINVPGVNSNSHTFWGTNGGKVFVTNIRTGEYVADFECPKGGIQGNGPIISKKHLLFGCGTAQANGNVVRVYEH
jgi:hypothetical protein